jgi:hypothetical protein
MKNLFSKLFKNKKQDHRQVNPATKTIISTSYHKDKEFIDEMTKDDLDKVMGWEKGENA